MRIAFIQESLRSGGAQKMIHIVADALARRGHDVDLLLLNDEGPLRTSIPQSVRVLKIEPSSLSRARLSCLFADPAGIPVLVRPVILPRRPSHTLVFLPGVARYLAMVQPCAVFSAKPLVNIEAVLAHRLVHSRARLVLSERTHLTAASKGGGDRRRRIMIPLIRRLYPRADAIVAVSRGVSEDLISMVGIEADKVVVIYNPTVTPDLVAKAQQPANHPWLTDNGPPVILSVGRLGAQKDHATLLRAFAKVRSQRPVRLILVGESRAEGKRDQRIAEIHALAESLGIVEDLSLTGFHANPYSYMSRADLFVLSSRFEGFPNVLVEALACGCPVVSTDCPSGPSEILGGGEFGKLVPIGDDEALSKAILVTLEAPPDRAKLVERARRFSYDTAIDQYEAVLTGTPAAN